MCNIFGSDSSSLFSMFRCLLFIFFLHLFVFAVPYFDFVKTVIYLDEKDFFLFPRIICCFGKGLKCFSLFILGVLIRELDKATTRVKCFTMFSKHRPSMKFYIYFLGLLLLGLPVYEYLSILKTETRHFIMMT